MRVSAPKPFAEVKDEIRQQLTRTAASEMAMKAGREKLALLTAGKDAGIAFDKPMTLGRNQVQPGVTAEALKQIFEASEAKLPAYTGAANERGGFSIYKIDKVIEPPAPDAAKIEAASSRVGSEIGRELMNAYLASLKADTDVKINQAALEKKSTQ